MEMKIIDFKGGHSFWDADAVPPEPPPESVKIWSSFLPITTLYRKYLMISVILDRGTALKSEDLTKYDCYVGYLFPHSMEKLDKVIFCDQNKGKIVISNTFKFPNKTAEKVIDKMLLYRVKRN